MSKRAVSIHGHFYQPVREDPTTGLIPREDGAFPYHDWNERVHEQCYRPNADQGNFEWISFDIGPTLFNWMLSYDSITVSKIIQQERKNFLRHGVGNA
ncbi:glycoside hydrolase, partial [bacterium]|nr:glycoside hydrolase [bacterium]